MTLEGGLGNDTLINLALDGSTTFEVFDLVEDGDTDAIDTLQLTCGLQSILLTNFFDNAHTIFELASHFSSTPMSDTYGIGNGAIESIETSIGTWDYTAIANMIWGA
jgi:hypothetical protein